MSGNSECWGSHRQYVHATKPGRVTIAHHSGQIIPVWTLAEIVKQAGLTVDQFRNLL
jgi:predicted RNA binding protein YcfA (HicA-like mRNA interferase family)